MQFKTNHSPGPWSFDRHDIRDANRHYIIDTDDIQKMSDIKAITQVPTMLKYMMDRTKALHDMLLWQPNWEGKPVPWQRLELDKILAILKDAGVEVVE